MTKRNANRQRVFDSLPGTSAQIAAKLGLGNVTVWRWLCNLVKAEEAFIYRYANVENGGTKEAHYKAGKVPANFKPWKTKNKTDERKSREYRQRKRASGDWEDAKLKNRQKYYLQRSPKIDILTAHFYKGFSNDTP